VPAGERGARLRLGGKCRPWPLPAAQREGDTFVDCHGTAEGDGTVVELGAEALAGG